ncbi:MAG: U32 family peptidase [Spirochaetaceae bacterium]|nr:U32 family peptidase [Spirochaetaceae bacterium]
MELVAPAGNAEKLKYAFLFGADSVYIGLKNFSLRLKADNFHAEEYAEIAKLKEDYAKKGMKKQLFCAVNISFHNDDIRHLEQNIPYFKQYPFDAFIVQDIGIVGLLKKHFPDIPLHLSTQANCTNAEAVKVYKSLGFTRVVLAREVSLAEIAEIKQAVPDMELECFAHGSMCMAYSGRCLISAYLTGRSANAGSCAHACRWNYNLVAKGSSPNKNSHEFAVVESERQGEYFPIEEGENYTAFFSSKDLCMIDYLDKMKEAGVDALKIEGRMKSLYYTALVTRAYRKKIDAIEGKISETEAAPFIAELYNTQHREFSTGFYFSPDDANKTTKGSSDSPYTMLGTLGALVSEQNGVKRFVLNALNKFEVTEEIEFVGPDTLGLITKSYHLIDPETNEERTWVCHGHECLIETDDAVEEGFIVRKKAARS